MATAISDEAAAVREPASTEVAQTMMLKAKQALRDGDTPAASVDLTLQALRQRLAADIANGKPIRPKSPDRDTEQ